MDLKNENGELPADCMLLHKNPKCKMIVKVWNVFLRRKLNYSV